VAFKEDDRRHKRWLEAVRRIMEDNDIDAAMRRLASRDINPTKRCPECERLLQECECE
jgi:hypothetical protein